MKKIILFLLIALPFLVSAQKTTPGNYTYVAQRYEWIAGVFQALGLPAGGNAAFKVGQAQRAGAVYFDSTGADAGFYIYDGTTWVLQGSGEVTQSALDDTAAAIRSDFPNAWNIAGNAGTDGSNFLGTTDDQPLYFKINNTGSGGLNRSTGNTSFGYNALAYPMLFGQRNTAIGDSALGYISSGSDNVAVGYKAGAAGSAGVEITDGINNTFIGSNAGGTHNSTTNAISIGKGVVAATNETVIGNTSTDSVRIYGLNGAVGTKSVRYDPTTGKVSYADTSTGGGSKFGKSGEDATGAETRTFNTGAFDFTINQNYGGGAFSQFKLDYANQKARIRSETSSDYSYTDYQSTQIYNSSYNVAADREARLTVGANANEIRAFMAEPFQRHDLIIKSNEIRNTAAILNYYLEGLPLKTSMLSTDRLLLNDNTGKVFRIEKDSLGLGGGTPELTQYRLAVGDASNLLSSNVAITPSMLLGSDANGVPVALTPTVTEANYISGLSSNAQIQLDDKVNKSTNQTGIAGTKGWTNHHTFGAASAGSVITIDKLGVASADLITFKNSGAITGIIERHSSGGLQISSGGGAFHLSTTSSGGMNYTSSHASGAHVFSANAATRLTINTNGVSVQNGNLFNTGYAMFTEIASPSTPSSGRASIYAKSDGLWYGKDDAGVETKLTNETTASGTYTPTFTNVTNITSSTPSDVMYQRIDNIVMVTGLLTVTPTATGLIELRMTLPIASALTQSEQLNGPASFQTNIAGHVAGDETNDAAMFRWIATGTTAFQFRFTYTYQIL